MEPFELYPKQGTVQVSLELLSQQGKATAEQMDLLEAYYVDVVVRHVLEITDVLIDFDKRGLADGPLFVPVDNGKVFLETREVGSYKTHYLFSSSFSSC
jgi:hypothetical protein